MGRFLKALEKVGLVQVEGESDELLYEAAAEPIDVAQTEVADTVEPVSAPVASGGAIAEGQAFDSFYTGITPSPYPAEKMLKLLDGLQAMDAATRQAAVKAMDSADDSWSIDDSVADAKAKIKALTGQASAFTAQVTAIEKETEASIKALDGANDKAVTAIRKQISELEALLARQIEKNGGDKMTAQNQLQAAREACTRETGRLHAESSRLSVLVDMFGATPQ
jgi:hypothetical protein